VALGSRYVCGGRTVNWSPLRRLISRGGSIYARTVLGVPIHDLTGGFKCFRRYVLEMLDLESVTSTGYAFQIELTYRAVLHGYRIAEIPIVFAERRHGRSKMSAGIMLEAVLKVLQLRLGTGIRPLGRPIPAPVSTEHPQGHVGGAPGG
jgi:dolichol-phosphate mannosyltransferase